MAKKSAKKNRFTKWRKSIASTIKRTGRGLKRGVGLAWEMTKNVERSVLDVTAAISRSAHRSSPARRAQQRALERGREVFERQTSEDARMRGVQNPIPPPFSPRFAIEYNDQRRAEQLARNDSTALTKTEQFEIKLNDADYERRRQAKKDDATRLEHIRNDRELQRLRSNGILDHTANGKAKEWHEYQAEQLARNAQRDTPTTAKVRQHDRQGTDGVTAHERRLTGKQREQATRDRILGEASRPTVEQRGKQAKTTPTGRSAINLDAPAINSPTRHLRKFDAYQVKKT